MGFLVALDPDGREFTPIHFVYESPAGLFEATGESLRAAAETTGKIACAPNATQLHAYGGRLSPWLRTSEVRAVTCPLCRASLPFRRAEATLQAVLKTGQFWGVIHFAVPGGVPACDGDAQGPATQQTDEVRGVTCPLCRATLPFWEAQARLNVLLASRKAYV